jgi:hypothetical protein
MALWTGQWPCGLDNDLTDWTMALWTEDQFISSDESKEDGEELSHAEKCTSREMGVDDLFLDLLIDIHEQRKALVAKEQMKLDSLWGLTMHGDFVKHGAPLNSILCKQVNSAADVIKKEMQFVKEETKRIVERLRPQSDAKKGIEILHLFILDLLGRGTPNAIMFQSKMEEDFRQSYVVTRFFKALAWSIVIALNVFFVCFSVIKAREKGQAWQWAYVYSCGIQLVIEVLFYESTECVLTQYVFPDLACSDVRGVRFTLQKAVQSVCSPLSLSPPLLDATQYLFLSTNVSREFPDLVESAIVQSYHSYSPGALSWKWRPTSNRRRGVTLSMVLMTILSVLSSDQQKAIIHIIQPLAIAGLGLGFSFMQSHPVLFVIPGVLLLVAGSYAGDAIRSYRNSIEIVPLNDESQVSPIPPSFTTVLIRAERGENKSEQSLLAHTRPVAGALDPFLGVIPESEEGFNWTSSDTGRGSRSPPGNSEEGVVWNSYGSSSGDSMSYHQHDRDGLLIHNDPAELRWPLLFGSNSNSSSEGGSVMSFVASGVSSRPNSNDMSLFLFGCDDYNMESPSEEEIRHPSLPFPPLSIRPIAPLNEDSSAGASSAL